MIKTCLQVEKQCRGQRPDECAAVTARGVREAAPYIPFRYSIRIHSVRMTAAEAERETVSRLFPR